MVHKLKIYHQSKILISHQCIDERYPLDICYLNIELMFNDFNVQIFYLE